MNSLVKMPTKGKKPTSLLSKLEAEAEKLNKDLSTNKEDGKFAKEVFGRLPQLLKVGCDTLVDEIEKEVFLVGSLGIISGLLPKVYTIYDGNKIYPNLYVAVLGKFGSGKSSLKFAKMLAKGVRDFLRRNEKSLFIPANNSKTGVLELLHKNNGRGIIFETEASTLATAMKSEHGRFKDVLLRAFHHEDNSLYRSTDDRRISIDEPKLSCVLSSTSGQFKGFIPNMEDGLFSRFIYYYTSGGKVEFRDVFNPQKSNYAQVFNELSVQFKNIYTQLMALEKEICITLKEAHQKEFVKSFEEWTKFFYKQIDEDLAGAVFRIAVICFRIMMIFTVLRFFEKHKGKTAIKTTNLEVEEIDFRNALEITEVLINGSIDMYDDLPEKRKRDTAKKKEVSNKEKVIGDKKEGIKRGLQDGLSPKQIQLKLRLSRKKYYIRNF